MQNFKDSNNKLHVIDPAFAHLLPQGCEPITEQEAAGIVLAQEAAASALSPIEKIRAIESRPEVTDALTRLTRQKAIADRLADASESMPEDKAHAHLMAVDKFYAVLVNAEAEIEALRGGA